MTSPCSQDLANARWIVDSERVELRICRRMLAMVRPLCVTNTPVRASCSEGAYLRLRAFSPTIGRVHGHRHPSYRSRCFELPRTSGNESRCGLLGSQTCSRRNRCHRRPWPAGDGARVGTYRCMTHWGGGGGTLHIVQIDKMDRIQLRLYPVDTSNISHY